MVHMIISSLLIDKKQTRDKNYMYTDSVKKCLRTRQKLELYVHRKNPKFGKKIKIKPKSKRSNSNG